MMDAATVVSLVKERLGIKTTVRDTYLTSIVDGILAELSDEKGLVLDGANPYHLMFVVDYATWRYQSVTEGTSSSLSMPRHLQYRLHNLMVHVGAANIRVDAVLTVSELPATPVAYTVYILPDGTKQMYLDDVWTQVDLVGGQWQVVTP